METILSTSYLYPQAVISNGLVTGNSWSNPNYILSADGYFAEASPSQASDIIVGNFNLSVPQGAVIQGIQFQVIGYAAAITSPLTTLSFNIVDDTSGENVYYPYGKVFSGFTTTSAVYTFGGPTYDFGQDFTPDQINNLKLQLTASGDLFVDAVQVQVFYYIPESTTPTPSDPTGVPGYQSQLQALPFTLSRPLGSTDTVMYLNSFTYPNGNTIQVGDIQGGYLQLTIDPDLASSSDATGFAENVQTASWSLTNIGTEMMIDFGTLENRGLDFKWPYGSNSFNIVDHAKDATVIITANAPFLQEFVKRTEVFSPLTYPPLAVQYATTATLPGNPVYDNGTAGVGATLTATANAALFIDGNAPALNSLVLVKNQSTVNIQRPLVQSSAQSYIGHTISGTAPKPSGLAVGDLFLIYVHYINSGQTLTTPAGYTLLNSTSNVGGNYTIATLYKVAASGDVSGSGPTIAFSTSTYARVASVRVTNFDPGGIFGTPAVANQSGVYTFTSAVSVTPASADSLVMFSYGEVGSVNSGMGNSGDTAFGTPEGTVTGLQNWVDSSPTFSSGTVVYDDRTTTSSTNGFTVNPGSNYADWVGTLVVINPLSASPTATPQYNGVYTVTVAGDSTHPYVLTRTSNYDTANQINLSGPIAVLYGTVNSQSGWLLYTQINTVGTDGLSYEQVWQHTAIMLETNGVANGSQTILNLKAGTNITITDDGVGGITITSSGGGGGTPGGSNTQLQYNNSGSFGGITGATTNGTIVTLTNPAISGATITSSTVNGVSLTTGGSATTYLNGAGAYTTPSGGGTGITWSVVTTTTQTAAINNGYVTNNASLVTVTLPSTAAAGSIVEVVGLGAGGWKVAQTSSVLVNFGNKVTTTGTGGSLASTNQYDAVRLVCTVANTEWSVISSVGNITIV